MPFPLVTLQTKLLFAGRVGVLIVRVPSRCLLFVWLEMRVQTHPHGHVAVVWLGVVGCVLECELQEPLLV